MQLDIPAGEFAGYIFDLDGTLIDTMPLHYRAWDKAMLKHVEWAAAISSSGLVLPFGASAREAQLTSSGPNAPLPAS